MALPRVGPPAPPASAMRKHPRGCPTRDRAGIDTSDALDARVTFCRLWGVASMACQCGKGQHQRAPAWHTTAAHVFRHPQEIFARDGAACRAPGEPMEPQTAAIVRDSLRYLVIIGMALPRGGPPSPPACAMRKHPRGCPTRDRAGIDTSDALHVRVTFCRWWGVASMACQCGKRQHQRAPAWHTTAANVLRHPQETFARDGAACRAPGEAMEPQPSALVCDSLR